MRKRRSKRSSIRLEKVIGRSVDNSYQISTNSLNGDIAYCAGNVVVVYDYYKNRQTKFLQLNKVVSCVEYSENGKFLAVGCGVGKNSEIIILDSKSYDTISKVSKVHLSKILAITFSGSSKLLISIGDKCDGVVKIYSFDPVMELIYSKKINYHFLFFPQKEKRKLSEKEKKEVMDAEKYDRQIYSVSFSKDEKSFVLSGDRFLIFYTLKKESIKDGTVKVRLEGRKINLSKISDKKFIRIQSYRYDPIPSSTNQKDSRLDKWYAMTSDGYLVLFSKNRVEKWVNLNPKTKKKKKRNVVVKGCSIFVARDMIICGLSNGMTRIFTPLVFKYVGALPKPSYAINSKIVALKYYANDHKLSVVFGNRSFVIYDLKVPKKGKFFREFRSHSSKIYGLDLVKNQPSLSKNRLSKNNVFVTCSEDSTIRFWDLDDPNGVLLETLQIEETVVGGAKRKKKKVGVRTVKFSPDGKYLASGDTVGNVRIFDLTTTQKKLVSTSLAHESEIIAMDFTSGRTAGSSLLVTGSRDKYIHTFQFIPGNDLRVVRTLDEHTSSITGLKFAKNGTKLISTSADQSIVFRDVSESEGKVGIKQYSIRKVGETDAAFYSCEVDPTNKYVVTCGEDKEIKIWDIEKAKIIRTYRVDKGGISNCGDPISLVTDYSGFSTITASTDKFLRLYDFLNGDLYAKFNAHSEVVTGIAPTTDCKRLITVGLDGLICVWKFSKALSNSMKQRRAEIEKYIAGEIATPRLMGNGRGPIGQNERVKKMIADYVEMKNEQDQKDEKEETDSKSLKKKDSIENIDKNDTLLFIEPSNSSEKKDQKASGDNAWAKRMDTGNFDLAPISNSIDAINSSKREAKTDADDGVQVLSLSDSLRSIGDQAMDKSDTGSSMGSTGEMDTQKNRIVKTETPVTLAGYKDEVLKNLFSPSARSKTKKKSEGFERKSITELFKEKKNERALLVEKEKEDRKLPERLSFPENVIPSPIVKRSMEKRKSVEKDEKTLERDIFEEKGEESKEESTTKDDVSQPLNQKTEDVDETDNNTSSTDILKDEDEINDLKTLREMLKKKEEEKKQIDDQKQEMAKRKEMNEKYKENLHEFKKNLDLMDTQKVVLKEIEKERLEEKKTIEKSRKGNPDESKKVGSNDNVLAADEKVTVEVSGEGVKQIEEVSGEGVKQIEEVVTKDRQEEEKDTSESIVKKEEVLTPEDSSVDIKIDPVDEEKDTSMELDKNEIMKKTEIFPNKSDVSPTHARAKKMQVPSIRLSRSVSEYQKAIMNLKSSFTFALNCFKEVNQEVYKSKILEPNFREDETTSSLLKGFTDVFQEISSKTKKTSTPGVDTQVDNVPMVRKSLIGPNYQTELQKFSTDLLRVFKNQINQFIEKKTKEMQ